MPPGRRRHAAIALAIASVLLACHPRPPRFTNLVVIVVDTLRSDHLPAYGYSRDTAPALSRLAAEGVQLQGYAASSWTKPSVATLFTGLVPQRHQAISLNDRLPEDAPYLPAILGGRGFTTLAFIGNGSNLGGKQGFRRGFTSSKQWMGPPKIHAGEVNRRTVELLAQARPPYFLWVHYVDPHDPYDPPAPFAADFSRAGYLQPQGFNKRGLTPTAAEMQRMIDEYDGEILEVDQAIGAMIEELRRRQLLDRTLVAITADHGEEFGEHGGLMHSRTLHEEVVRVPFILWASHGLSPFRSQAPFSLVDFLPTALAALGVDPPQGLDGTSQWAELCRLRPPGPRSLTFHLDRTEGAELALLESPLKLIERWGEPDELLFDLSGDPGEEHPLSNAGARIAEMRRRLYAAHVHGSGQALRRAGRNVDAELQRQLDALGYLAGGSGQRALAGRRLPIQLDPAHGLGTQAAPPN